MILSVAQCKPHACCRSSVFLAGRACGMTSTSGVQNGRGQLQVLGIGELLSRAHQEIQMFKPYTSCTTFVVPFI
eukprot:1180146-Prorocentrum_minimum.AAC.2